MRRITAYRFLTLFCLGVTVVAIALAAVAASLAHAFEAGAAALCAGVFFVPGLLFLRYWRRLGSRELALAHVANLAEGAGVAESRALGEQLEIPEADTTKILQTAIREGHLRGEVDASGRFVAASAPRCPACGTAVPRTAGAGLCPSCGKPLPGGG